MNVKMQNSFFRCVLAQCVECQNTLLIQMSSIQTDLTQQMKGMSSMKHVCANYTPGRGNLKFEHLGKVHRDSEYAVMIADSNIIIIIVLKLTSLLRVWALLPSHAQVAIHEVGVRT